MNSKTTAFSFNQRLERCIASRRSRVCVGLDVDLASLPGSVSRDRKSVETFLRAVIDSTAEYAAAFKPNLAFFFALGEYGLEILSKLRGWIPPEVIIVGDCKWGDIGNTADHYAKAAFEILRFDAVTVNPYQGTDSILPFLQRPDRGAFVLCRPSNPSAGEFQGLGIEFPVYIAVAKAAARWNRLSNCGLVMGATSPDAIGEVRGHAPDLPILIPGIGAQGGDLAGCVRHLRASVPATFIVSASRSILYADSSAKYWKGAALQARELQHTINTALLD